MHRTAIFQGLPLPSHEQTLTLQFSSEALLCMPHLRDVKKVAFSVAAPLVERSFQEDMPGSIFVSFWTPGFGLWLINVASYGVAHHLVWWERLGPS